MEDILGKIRERSLPDNVMEAIVAGILPLDTGDLITALFLICQAKQDLIEKARVTFSELAENVKLLVFEDRRIDPDLLDFYLVHFPLSIEVKQICLIHPKVRGTTILAIAARIEAELLDVAVNNQVKILEEPGIVDALLSNPVVSINQRQKLEEYKRLLLKDVLSPPEELENQSLREVEENAISDAREFVRTFGKESGPLSESLGEVAVKRESLLKQIQSMSVPQRVQAAIKGNREHRMILVRDANRMVSSAVIRSPKITEAEVEFISNLRNVQQEVLRLISLNREWTKSYKIISNLVKNPRTPLSSSMKLMPRMSKRDLRFLIKDRGVPEVLRTLARRQVREEEKSGR